MAIVVRGADRRRWLVRRTKPVKKVAAVIVTGWAVVLTPNLGVAASATAHSMAGLSPSLDRALIGLVPAASASKRPKLQLDYSVESTASYQIHYKNPTNHGKWREDRSISLKGEIPLNYAGSASELTGKGELTWTSHSWSSLDEQTGLNQAGQICTTDDYEDVVAVAPGTIAVKSLVLGAPPGGGTSKTWPHSLDLVVAGVTETWHENFRGNGCAGSANMDNKMSNFETELTSFYQQRGGSAHEIIPLSGPTTVELTIDTGWQRASGSTVAQRVFQGEYQPTNPGGFGVGAKAHLSETIEIVTVGGKP